MHRTDACLQETFCYDLGSISVSKTERYINPDLLVLCHDLDILGHRTLQRLLGKRGSNI